MPFLRFRIRTTILVAGIALWLLVACIHARTIFTCIILMTFALLGLPVNTREGFGDALLLFVLLAAAPVVLIGVYFAPIWGEPRPIRLPRMTTRRWMIAVAIFGTLLGGCMGLYRRSESFERMASYHSRASEQLYDTLGPLPYGTTVETIRIMSSRGPKQVQTLEAALYHDFMAHKYAGAARQPWFRVPPDPPLSDWVRNNLPAQ